MGSFIEEFRCIKCGETKPRAQFLTGKGSPRPQNRRWCHDCAPMKTFKRIEAEYTCTTCGEIKQRAAFLDADGKLLPADDMSCDVCRGAVAPDKPVRKGGPVVNRRATDRWAGQTKYCSSCRTEKPVSDFVRERPGRSPRAESPRDTCNECARPKPKSKKQEDIRKEMATRALMRKSLIHFVTEFVPGYQPGWVHKLICAKLERFREDVVAQKSPRLMLFLPPRSGKSEIASKMFPAWYLGHSPRHELITCSYALALPMDFSKKIKGVLMNPRYKGMFPLTKLDKNAQATEGWKTTEGGAYVAAGVQGPITGKGAHCLIIDDPVKDAEEADSETIRHKTWNWYGSTARTRLAPGAGILLIMTRWHDDDLAGRLLREEAEARKEIMDNEDLSEKERENELTTLEGWEVISFPALATATEWWAPESGAIVHTPESGQRLLRNKGEALHPERFPRSDMLKLQRTLQPRHWSALYQQNPTPDEGSFFTKAQLRYEEHVPDTYGSYVFCAWDLAIGQKQQNDYTVGIAGAINYRGELHLLDMVRGRMNSHEIAEAVWQMHVRWGAAMTGMERGQLELAIRPTLDGVMKKRGKTITLAEGEDALTPISDKLTRARPLQGLMQQGRVYLPSDQDWTEELRGELLRFPLGVFDDCVDSLAWLARMVLRVGPPKDPREAVRKMRPPSWKDRLKGLGHGRDWRAA
jgi:predicted phage terminase large subunit-like protein